MKEERREEGFLSRWARRKNEEKLEAEETVQAPASQEVSKETPPADASGEGTAPEELPDPESRGRHDDWTPFLKQNVPQELRVKALRRLWRLDPVFANLDGLVDYAEDYNGTQFTGQPIKTLFQVGRGMVLDDDPEEARPEGGGIAEAGGSAMEDAAETPAGEAEGCPDDEIEAADAAEAGAQAGVPAQDIVENQLSPMAGEDAGARILSGAAPRRERGRALARRWGLDQRTLRE